MQWKANKPWYSKTTQKTNDWEIPTQIKTCGELTEQRCEETKVVVFWRGTNNTIVNELMAKEWYTNHYTVKHYPYQINVREYQRDNQK